MQTCNEEHMVRTSIIVKDGFRDFTQVKKDGSVDHIVPKVEKPESKYENVFTRPKVHVNEEPKSMMTSDALLSHQVHNGSVNQPISSSDELPATVLGFVLGYHSPQERRTDSSEISASQSLLSKKYISWNEESLLEGNKLNREKWCSDKVDKTVTLNSDCSEDEDEAIDLSTQKISATEEKPDGGIKVVSPEFLYHSSDVYTMVNTLSKVRMFSSSLEELRRSTQFNEDDIKTLGDKYPQVFSLNMKCISLKPQLEVCKNHCGPSGCRKRADCNALHICTGYVMQKCQEQMCALGHRWDTDHNNKILKKLFLDALSAQILQKLVAAFGGIPDTSTIIDICQDYNGDGCFNSSCSGLHICSSLLLNLTSGIKTLKCPDSCLRNHDFHDSSCLPLLSKCGIPTNETPRDIALAIINVNPSISFTETRGTKRNLASIESDQYHQSTTAWSYHLIGNVDIPEICYQSVSSKCPQEQSGCQRMHSTLHYHWQVSEDREIWLNLSPAQVECLEHDYCNPSIDSVVLPILDPGALGHLRQRLFLLLGRDIWTSDFYSMTMSCTSSNKVLSIRRLCTQRVDGITIKPSCFSWYFNDASGMWIEYGKVSQCGSSDVTSKCIEDSYRSDPNAKIIFSSPKFQYMLDCKQKTQQNLKTGTIRQVMRRPEIHLQNKDVKDLPEIWTSMLLTQRVQHVVLCESSAEFKNVYNHIQQNNPVPFLWVRIERIQNPYLWRAFQNKLKEMQSVLATSGTVDVRYLFHGTFPNTVKNICEENFDWRLHGAKHGIVYGRGSYFSTNFRYSIDYATKDQVGHRYMFIAQVAVGSMAIGNNSMTRPPINPATNAPFDSTVNNLQNPTIIVKYDKQEYYPEYLVTFVTT